MPVSIRPEDYPMSQAIADCVDELVDNIAWRYEKRMKAKDRRTLEQELGSRLEQAVRIVDARYAAQLGVVQLPWEAPEWT